MTDRSASICDVLPAAAAVLGVPGAEDRLGVVDQLGPARRVVVVLVDGMGYHLLAPMAAHAPLLASALAGATGSLSQLSCTFPSTTPTSLVSLATGVAPGEHGILGFTVNVPGTDRVLTHILWRDEPQPATWQPVPTSYERLAAAGRRSSAVLPAYFAGSGLTEAAYRGARFRGVGKGQDYVAELLDEVRSGPGLVYGYTAALDTAAHRYGIASPEWAQAAAGVDAVLGRIVAGLPSDTVLLVTADHGGLDVPQPGRVDLNADPRLADGIRVVAGEPRVRYLHVADGAVADVRATWQAVLGDRADVLLRDEAVAAGMFGPVRPAHLPRIGDVVVICGGDTVVLATGHEPPEIAALIGFHGSVTPAETAIPLLALRT
ncbi:MAG: alkaline phosphatase family protein [Jatrophihabitans sp.]|uniref:alkaline phosphatase family protein n=1 Tax=Jatrophihabitans sp. TaxID=1932789 RepID=UPI003911E11A